MAKVAASTPAVRPDVSTWLRRELDIALFLTRAGAPVLAPSCEVPATVHHGDGQVMSFWTYLKPVGPGRPDEATIGSMLRDLHATLRTYPETYPVLTPLGDPAQLRTCQDLRRLSLTVWYALYAERLPECRQRAADLLAAWRTPSS